MNAAPLAVELADGELRLRWSDAEGAVPTAVLRSECRCAECAAARLLGLPQPDRRDVALVDAEPVGHYALRLHFDDGHARGIYPWPMLRELSAVSSHASSVRRLR